jgi:hypothetical protein
MRNFDALRTAEEELRSSTHCGLRRRNFGVRRTADCGGGTSDFHPLRTAEEELRTSTHCGLRRRNFGFRRTADCGRGVLEIGEGGSGGEWMPDEWI